MSCVRVQYSYQSLAVGEEVPRDPDKQELRRVLHLGVAMVVGMLAKAREKSRSVGQEKTGGSMAYSMVPRTQRKMELTTGVEKAHSQQ